MPIQKVEINNFTVFEQLTMQFSSGIQVIIGGNGTGKTHLMKGVYAVTNAMQDLSGNTTAEKIQLANHYFRVDAKKLIRSAKSETDSTFCVECNAAVVAYHPLNDAISTQKGKVSAIADSVFIPAKEFLTHSDGFISLYDERNIPFDKTYRDILSKALLPKLRELPDMVQKLTQSIAKIAGGKVVVKNDNFYLKKGHKEIDFSVESEGIKKIAILWQLLMNGSIQEGTVLFLDEPDANINPKMMQTFVTILLALSKLGVQIFVATHDYFFAKYIDILMDDTHDVSFHALYNTKDNGVQCETEKRFSLLDHNLIMDENIKLYEAELEKVLE